MKGLVKPSRIAIGIVDIKEEESVYNPKQRREEYREERPPRKAQHGNGEARDPTERVERSRNRIPESNGAQRDDGRRTEVRSRSRRAYEGDYVKKSEATGERGPGERGDSRRRVEERKRYGGRDEVGSFRDRSQERRRGDRRGERSIGRRYTRADSRRREYDDEYRRKDANEKRERDFGYIGAKKEYRGGERDKEEEYRPRGERRGEKKPEEREDRGREQKNQRPQRESALKFDDRVGKVRNEYRDLDDRDFPRLI